MYIVYKCSLFFLQAIVCAKNLLLLKMVTGEEISSGKAETLLTSVTKDTSFEDHMSEFVRRTENGAKKDQHVKVRLSSQY